MSREMIYNNRNVQEELITLGSKITFNYTVDELGTANYDTVYFVVSKVEPEEGEEENHMSGSYNFVNDTVFLDIKAYSEEDNELITAIIEECKLITTI